MRRASLVCSSLLAGGCLLANPAFDSAGAGTGSGTDPGATSLPGAPTTGDPPPNTSGAPPQCPSDEACDDGLFCNGAEICNPTRGCEPGPSPCEVDKLCLEDKDLCVTSCENDPDADGDGYPSVACMGGTDCDDQDPTIHPGATELCAPDSVDEDCDPLTFGSLDADGDGKVSSECCNVDGDGVSRCGDDCDDQQPGYAIGDWAHCGACLAQCGVQQACENNACTAARRAFVTSTTHDAALGGLAAADGMCQARADSVGLGGAFKAYIVDGTGDLNRLEHPGVPFVRLDGARIADNWGDLSDQSIKAPLALTETRQLVGGNAWTGLIEVNGSLANNHCTNWSVASMCTDYTPCGGAGEVTMTDNHWDGYYVFNCFDQYRLYCVEQ